MITEKIMALFIATLKPLKKGFMTLNYCVISNYSLKKLGAKACFDKRKTLSHLKLRIKKD